jgi:hypothetical protein
MGVLASAAMQAVGLPIHALASILGPYRGQWQMASQQRGSIWSIIGWAAAALPVGLLGVAAHLIWPPALWAVLAICLAVGLALDRATLLPLARLLARREFDILEAVTREE